MSSKTESTANKQSNEPQRRDAPTTAPPSPGSDSLEHVAVLGYN